MPNGTRAYVADRIDHAAELTRKVLVDRLPLAGA